MKKKVLIVMLILTLTGCMKIEDDIKTLTDKVISSNIKSNKVSNSYKYYLPLGATTLSDYEFNQTLRYKNNNIYLYVDIVSYYYKNKLNYKEDNNYNYYYDELHTDKKDGFIGINKENNYYFVKIVYNYSKIEFYSTEESLEEMVVTALTIANSIDYNDLIIKNLVGENSNSSKEIMYELDKPENTESKFSQYLEEYVTEEESYEELPDG